MGIITVRVVDDLPDGTKGFVMEDECGDYNIYLDARLSKDELYATYLHEMEHIRGCDFSRTDSADSIEKDVEKRFHLDGEKIL